MNIPVLSHLQFLVIGFFTDEKAKMSGCDLRASLAAVGHKKSDPAFYQFMARMEEAGFVSGWYETETHGGMKLKFRWYQVTARGWLAWEGTQAFYAQFLKGRRTSAKGRASCSISREATETASASATT